VADNFYGVLSIIRIQNLKASYSESPPAEREASGSPLKGGSYVGKAPLGLSFSQTNPIVLFQASLARVCTFLWFLGILHMGTKVVYTF